MTDYLELLLGQWEDEEEREANGEGAGVSLEKNHTRGAVSSVKGARRFILRNAKCGGTGAPSAEAGKSAHQRLTSDSRPRSSGGMIASDEFGGSTGKAAPYGIGTASALDNLLALDFPLSLNTPDTGAVHVGERTLYQAGSSAGGKAVSAVDGAAALERRLTEQSLATAAAAPARTLFVPEIDGTGASEDWDEFDRRLERDARRYDGGMGIY